MTQDQILTLVLKIGLISGILSLVLWVVVYGRLEPWWKDQIGLTLVTKTLIVVGQLSFLGLALFFRLNRSDNRLIAWLYAIFTLAITPVMIWRTVVWIRASKTSRQAQHLDDAEVARRSGKKDSN